MKKFFTFFISIIFVMTILFGINYYADKYNFRFDVTRFKQHTLSRNTKSIIKTLDNDVNITVLYVGLIPKYLEDILKEYELNSAGKIKTEIIDPLVDLGYAARFGNIIKGGEKKAVIQRGQERRDIDFTENPLTEEQITNAIIRVTRKARKIYYLTGHNEFDPFDSDETGYNTFTKLLLANNIMSETVMLGISENIPEDCDVLVIAGPKNNLSGKEEKIIKEYLQKGGDALFLIENVVITTPDKPLSDEEKLKNPSLNNILNDWGINVNNDIVVDLSSHATGDVGSPATKNYMNHTELIKGLDYTFYVRPRSISFLENRKPTIKIAPFVMTSSGEASWGETNRELNVKFDKEADMPGPVPISFVIWEARTREKTKDTRIIVFTDGDFLSNAYIGLYSNAQMGINLINWLSELDYQLFLDKTQIEIHKMNPTNQQKKTVLFYLVLIPFMIALSWVIFRIKK